MFKSFFTFLLIFICSGTSDARTEFNLTEESDIYQKTADVSIHTVDETVFMSQLYSNTPLIVAFIFTRCAGICNPFIIQLKENLGIYHPDENYRVLVISFDLKDQLEDMLLYAKRFGLEKNDKWIFGITTEIDKLNSSVSFYPVWDEKNKQFNHDALLVGINENGYIAKKLTGIRDAKAISSLIKEINNEFIISYPLPRENMLFSCFTFNPATGKKSPSWGLLILLVPAILTIGLVSWLAARKRTNPVL